MIIAAPSATTTTAATVAVVLLCGLTIALVLAAPVSAGTDGKAAPLLYALFASVCHQIEERSFHIGGEPLAVCHRCFGFYVGFTLGLAFMPRMRRACDWILDRPRRILLFLAPTAIDWLLPFDTPASRFSTALLAAAPIAVLVLAAIRQIAERDVPGLSGETS